MIHKVQIDGPRFSMCREARRLIAEGVASESDTLDAYRGSMLCLSGNVGRLSGLTLVERDSGSPTFEWRKFVPFDASKVRQPRNEPQTGRP